MASWSGDVCVGGGTRTAALKTGAEAADEDIHLSAESVHISTSPLQLQFLASSTNTSMCFFLSFPQLCFFVLNHADYSHLILYISHKQANTGHKLDPL